MCLHSKYCIFYDHMLHMSHLILNVLNAVLKSLDHEKTGLEVVYLSLILQWFTQQKEGIVG